jgi:hypothetical protein
MVSEQHIDSIMHGATIKLCKIFSDLKVLNFRLENDEGNRSRNCRNISDDTLPICMLVHSAAA